MKTLIIIALFMMGCKGEVTQTDIERATGLQFMTIPEGSVLVVNKEGDLEWITPTTIPPDSVFTSSETVDVEDYTDSDSDNITFETGINDFVVLAEVDAVAYETITITDETLTICLQDNNHCIEYCDLWEVLK